MLEPIHAAEYVDLYPRRLGETGTVQALVFAGGKLVSLIVANSRSYAYIFSSVFDGNYTQIYPAISIATEAAAGIVSNPSVRMLNGKYLFFWYQSESFNRVRSIQAMLVEDNAHTFAHSDTAYGRTRGSHYLFVNQQNENYAISLSDDNTGFVIAAANADGNILIKNFDARFNLISSVEPHIPFINNQQQIVSISSGYILFYNDPESGINKITYNQALMQVDNSEIVIDVNIGEIVNFNVIKSDSGILLICNNNGIIEAVALGLDGTVKGDITAINDPDSVPRYSLVSSSEVNVGPVKGGALIIIQDLQNGNKYGLLLDSEVNKWGDKFRINNDIRQMIPYPDPDDRYLTLKVDPLTNLDRVDAQIIRIDYNLVPSFHPSPSPSYSQYLASNSTTPLILSDSATPLISPSVALSYFFASASINASRPQITATRFPDSNEDGVDTGSLVMTVMFAIAAIMMMAMASRYYYVKKRRAIEGSIEMVDLDRPNQSIKDVLIEKQEEIITRATSKNESKKFVLLKDLLALAVEYREENKLESDNKPVKYSFDSDDIFVQMNLAASKKDSIALEFGLTNQDDSLLSVRVTLVKIDGDNFIVYEADNQQMFESQFQRYFANKETFINNLVNLLIRVNMQMIDYSINPDEQAKSLLSAVGFGKKSRVVARDELEDMAPQDNAGPSRSPSIKQAKTVSTKCIIL
jgi:hypothetical protein